MTDTVDSSTVELPDLATRQEAAAYMRVSVPTLARWAMDKEGPPFVRLGRSVRYPRAGLLKWVASQGSAAE